MRKGLQIVLLAVLFAASGVVGYFVGEYVFADEPAKKTATQKPIKKSSLPKYQNISELTKDSGGLYEFNAEYSAETGDRLTYSLYSDAECHNFVASNEDGRFSSVPGTESGKYYLKVTNNSTSETSEVMLINGFKKVYLVKRLSEEELLFLMRNGIQNMSPHTNQRISPNHRLILTNLRDDNDAPEDIRDVYVKLKSRIWKDVKIVSPPDYDSENRLTTLKIEAIYPQP